MENFSFTDLGLVLIFLWLIPVTILLLQVRAGWLKLSKGHQNLNFAQILEKLLSTQEATTKHVNRLSQEISQLSTLNKLSYQRSAIVRYNPFEDTGGDQSFIVALLNGNNSGFVISSLHSRNGTRVYAKQIVGGKPSNHDLSKEEKEVVDKAIKPTK